MPYRIVTTIIMASHRQASEASSRSVFPHGMEVQVYKETRETFALRQPKSEIAKAVRCFGGRFKSVVVAACMPAKITSPHLLIA